MSYLDITQILGIVVICYNLQEIFEGDVKQIPKKDQKGTFTKPCMILHDFRDVPAMLLPRGLPDQTFGNRSATLRLRQLFHILLRIARGRPGGQLGMKIMC